MRVLWPARALLCVLVAGCISIATAQKKAAASSPGDPVVISVHPFTVQKGSTLEVTVRGSALRGAKAAFVAGAPLRITAESVEPEPPGEGTAKAKTPIDLVHLRIEVAPDAKPGRYPFRLITPGGISNALPLHVTEYAVSAEPEGTHETPASAVSVAAVPAIYNGRLSRRGETDYYSFHAKAGETLTFEVISGMPQIAAAGSAATIPNFDPSLTIYEAAGSWFDPGRLKRIAFNDEPVWVFGKTTDTHLIHRFLREGLYLMRIEAFAGQGGADYGYQLKILPGEVPQDLAPAGKGWQERSYSRVLSSNRLNQLAARGGGKQSQSSIETYRAATVPVADAPMFKLPGTIEGTLTQPGETQRARFQLDGTRDIAIEVETPATAPPFFNPVVRLLNASGEEVATNIFAGRGACNGALSKSLQAKTLVPLRESGLYTIEVRDATADMSGPAFSYRVQVRQQVPHVGQVTIDTDHVNLSPDEAKTIRIVFDREEDFRGGVAVLAESLPPGVQAVLGADYEPDKDPPLFTGKRERYSPRTERTILVLTAVHDAAPTSQPQIARIVVRPLMGGKMGEAIATKSFPVMVVSKP